MNPIHDEHVLHGGPMRFRPYPIVNVIADKPSLTVGSVVKSERRNELRRATAASEERDRFEELASRQMRKESDLLKRLSALQGVASRFSFQQREAHTAQQTLHSR